MFSLFLSFPLLSDRSFWVLTIKVDDVITLLDTNNGVYGAACSMDYSKPPIYYDTFALRDSRGNEHVMQKWPYFRSAASRNALLALSPIPVKSCWNGMGTPLSLPMSSYVLAYGLC